MTFKIIFSVIYPSLLWAYTCNDIYLLIKKVFKEIKRYSNLFCLFSKDHDSKVLGRKEGSDTFSFRFKQGNHMYNIGKVNCHQSQN